MLRRLSAWLRERRRPRSERELAEQEAIRGEAEAERRRAEREMADQRRRIEGGGGGGFGR